MKPRILVLGGYGHFGARIVRALAQDHDLEVIVAGRDPVKARAKLADVGDRLQFCRLDINAQDFSEQLKSQPANVLIHTAGPFQRQGYQVARTCLEAGQHYIDLADGREFVRHFQASLDTLARQHQRVAITGASTLPAISSAVVDRLHGNLDRLDDIQIVIAPAQRTPLGLATMRAVLSCCGRSFDCWQDGEWRPVLGWRDCQNVTFPQLRPRLASPCDVPDHDLLVTRYPGVRTVRFRAALELPWLQHCLSLLSALRASGMHLPLDRLASFFARAGRWFDAWGSDLGGMSVELRGIKDGQFQAWRWDLTAPQLHGPEIPCMAAILLARRIARGQFADIGAYACMGLLALKDFDAEFGRWGITTEISGGPK
jgi:saccharopine dehydrogenase-like NADP-dependent oxidoreductase